MTKIQSQAANVVAEFRQVVAPCSHYHYLPFIYMYPDGAKHRGWECADCTAQFLIDKHGRGGWYTKPTEKVFVIRYDL